MTVLEFQSQTSDECETLTAIRNLYNLIQINRLHCLQIKTNQLRTQPNHGISVV